MIKFKALQYGVSLPTRAYPSDAGLDIIATRMEHKENYIEYGTGLAVEIPGGHVGLLVARSSISNKTLDLCNSVGVIDPNFRGELKFRFRITPTQAWSKYYEVGDKIGQLVVVPCLNLAPMFVNAFDEYTDRGENGFGSSGE